MRIKNKECIDIFRMANVKKNDLYIGAEGSLVDFTEKVCEIHGQYKGIYLIYYHVFEWLADKLLWRK